jgi:hypothetical protein
MSVPAGFVPPFHLDDFGLYINDSEHNMAADFNGPNDNPRPRGWGRIQYRDNGHNDMDEWEDWFLETIGTESDPEKIVELLNAHAGE